MDKKTQGFNSSPYCIPVSGDWGGRNTFDYFIGSYPAASRSHDREVLIYNTAHGTTDGEGSSLYQVEGYFNQVWNLDVCSLFHDNETLAGRSAVKQAAEDLRRRYDTLAQAHPELLGWESQAERQIEVSAEDPAVCGTLPGHGSCPALPIDSGINDDDVDFTAEPQTNPLDYYGTHTVPAGKITLVSNPVTIYAKEPIVFYTMAKLMEGARERVLIHTPYAVFNETMYKALSEVTEKVPVTMMINSVENGDNFFASSDYPRHKKAFIDTGMEILEYDGGLSYHGKSLVIDDRLCAIGSYNFDLRSTYMDTELMLVIESPALTAQLEEYMNTYQADCRRLLPDGTYEIPEHVTVAAVPFYKKAAWKVVGFVMQPFRFLI